MKPDSVEIIVSGKCVAGGSVIVDVSPLILRMEDQWLNHVTTKTSFAPDPFRTCVSVTGN